jgi:hypothetical protein
MRLGLASCVVLASAVLAACEPPPPATLEFAGQSPENPRLGEITTLRFRAIDSRGNAQPGTTVKFSLQSEVPGVTLSPEESTTDVGDGIATTQLTATGRVASVVVIATAGDKTAVSPVVSFAGAEASATQLTFQCGEFSGDASGGLHAIGAWDETRYLIAGVKARCIAHVGDRNGDGISGAQVSFLTEAGTVGPTATSVTDVVGNAEILYKTSYPIPEETDPGEFNWNPRNDATYTGDYLAPLWMHPFFWTANPIRDYAPSAPAPNINPFQPRPEPWRDDPIRPGRRNNPRDNLVAMIAVTTGEEGYDDLNNNGQCDGCEQITDTGEFKRKHDLTEPFVDNNDDGTRQPHERFVDANGNGQWDGKNGKHDESTLIWVQERLLWTGWPHPLDRVDLAPTYRFPVVRQIVPTPGTDVEVLHFKSAEVVFLLSDPWFNRIAQNANSDGCSGGNVGPVVVEPLASGVAFTYSSFAIESFVIRDLHDPAAVPQPNPYVPPLEFKVAAGCRYTAAQEGGHVVLVTSPTIEGTVH